MATSGSFLTSVGSGGGSYFNRLVFEWWRTGWGRESNRGYHHISFSLKTYGGNSGYWQNVHNISMNVAGKGYSRGTTQAYGAGATTLLSGSHTIYTDSAGNASFGASAQAGIYTYAINSSGSGSWSLDNIPMHASITSHSGNINDESNPRINFSNPGGGRVDAWLELPNRTGSTSYARRNNYKSGTNFNLTTAERNAIRNAMSDVNSTAVRYVIYTQNTGNWNFQDRTISIVNANPTFTTIDYHDSKSSTVAITGNDKYIVQGQSTINVDIASGNRALPKKGASIVRYTATINATSTNFNYSTGTINQALGGNSNRASSNQTLTVTATDSRGNTTAVQKTVLMVPYAAPVINAKADREDGFGEDTVIDVSGTFSTLTVAGNNKNSINASTGVGYKVWEVGGTEPGSYTSITSTTSGQNITTPTDPIETLDRDKAYNVKVKITDIVQTVTHIYVVPIGTAALRLGTDGNLYNNGKRVFAALDMYPVGTVLITSVNTNPQFNLGGTWVSTTTASQSLFGMTMYGWRRSA